MSNPTTDEQLIFITVKEYNNLLKSKQILDTLEGAGVDNWSGYDYAMTLVEGEN
ncbi:hypothetical protein [Dehalobacter sp. 14DCB1]|uniref:hypothetical protein n=1 Tax=Dehalobacter sp. 14DCB1 TaxID=2070227 RepID=UPI001404BAE7|nr:hypothetical protein [Dehalobacter sp. 14DCB1]